MIYRTAERESRRTQTKEIKQFEIQDKLGEGSYGMVYKVRDRTSGEMQVMKIIQLNRDNPCEMNEKLQECQVIKNLRHPYICRFKQYFVDENRLCILFEYCDKGDLDEYIKNQKGLRLSDSRIKKFILELLLAIEHMHSIDIIHRDLKPSNIFLKGKDYTIQVGDFGIACNTGG